MPTDAVLGRIRGEAVILAELHSGSAPVVNAALGDGGSNWGRGRFAFILEVDSLPWASFPESLQTEIIESMLGVLDPKAKFATFAYWQGVILPAGSRFNRRLRNTFAKVERSPSVWLNLPPAFVYRCTQPVLPARGSEDAVKEPENAGDT